MPVKSIVTTGEVLSYLGLGDNATDNDVAWVDITRRRTEAVIRRYLNSQVIQREFTHYFPKANPYDVRDADHLNGERRTNRMIRMDAYPVRDSQATDDDGNTISNPRVWEDEDGHFGQNTASTFPNVSEITYGPDFYLETPVPGLSKSGNLLRRVVYWYSRPGSIKVTYTAGWSRAELTGDVTDPNLDASDITLGVLKTVVEMFNDKRSKQGGGGQKKSETLGEYRVEFDTSVTGSRVALTDEVKDLLHPFKRMPLF